MNTRFAFRFANWDTPLWASPNRRAGRYGIAGDTVQYWCLHPMGCWAEYVRFHSITNADEAAELRPRPWVARMPVPDEIPRLTFDNARDHGVDPEELVDDDWTACQRWGQANHQMGAVIVPSAALPGTENLVVFGPRVRLRWESAPLGHQYVPTEVVADHAECMIDLLDHVRHRGDPHRGLEAWKRGDPPIGPPRIELSRTP